MLFSIFMGYDTSLLIVRAVSIEDVKTKTKPVTSPIRLFTQPVSNNSETKTNQSNNKNFCLISFDTQLKIAQILLSKESMAVLLS